MIDDLTTDDFDKYVTPSRKTTKEYRTDRNNNPIAAAVTTGGRNQFTDALDQAEIPWEHGDPFPGNPKLSTIKIKGDPIEGARAILGNSNALKWYRNTTGKQILPKYGVKSSADFLKLPIEHQNDIINGIYQSEGGNGKIKPAQDDFDKYVSTNQQSAPKVDDDFDKYITQQPTKTPQVTSSVREADTKTELPVEQSLSTKPVEFQPASKWNLHPTTNQSRAISGPGDLLMRNLVDEPPPQGMEAEFTQQRYKAPPSVALGRSVKIPFSPHLNPSPTEVVQGYLNTLGPDYAKYGEKYRQEQGHDILSLNPGDIQRDEQGNIYVQPSEGAVRILNAYVRSGGDVNAAKAEAAKIASERTSAATQAQTGAAQDVAEVEKIRKEQGVESGAERSLTAPAGRVTADTHKLIGGIASLSGLVPSDFSDYMNRRGEIIRQGASLPPLTEAGQEIHRGIPEKVATAAADTGLSIAQLILLKKATKLPLNSIMAIETGLKDTDKPASERAKDIAESYAMGSALEAHLDRATATAMFAVPTGVESAQQVARGQMSKEDAILNTMIQGGVGAALSGGGERPEDLRVTPRGEVNATTATLPEVAQANAGAATTGSGRLDRADEAGDVRPEPQLSERPTHQPSGDRAGGVEELGATATQPSSGAISEQGGLGDVPEEPIRHVDLQPRRVRGEGKGQFKAETKAQREERLATISRETITPSEDTPIGINDAGEQLYERPDGSRYRMRSDRKDRPNGYPDFGGDLAPVNPTEQTNTPVPQIPQKPSVDQSAAPAAPSEGGVSVPEGKGFGMPPIVKDMFDAAQKSAEDARQQVSNVRQGKIEGNAETVLFDFQGKTYKGALKGRNRDLMLGFDPEADKAIALRTLLDGHAEVTGKATAPSSPPEPETKASAVPISEATGVPSSPEVSEASARPAQGAEIEPIELQGQLPTESLTPSPREGVAAPASQSETTGIARRVEESRRGQPIENTNQGVSAEATVERGRRLLREGADPQEAVDNFRKSGAISADSMALVRAKHEELARAANQAFDKGGLNSPEFQAAEKARQDYWEQSVRPMQTEWAKTGMAQQGETDIDTGTFYGLYRAFKDTHSREPTPKEQVVLQNLSAKSAKAESDVKDLSSRLAAELDKAAGIKDLPPEIQQAVKRFVNESARESRRAGRQQTRKALDDEAAIIKTNLAAAFQKAKSQTGIQPSGLARIDPEGEITKQLIAYAKNRAQAGITDAAQLIDDVHSTVKEFADVTKREVAEAILGAGLPKKERTESEWAKLKTGVRQEVKDYTTQEAREALGTRLQGVKQIPAQDAAEVWKYARENYIDKGNTDFADVTQKVASDLGITPDQVRRSLANTSATKRISDEMWKKMSDRRQAKQNAESWVRQADQSTAAKAFENARRLFFLKATVGHGAVAPFTHAPANLFIPSRWADFFPNFGRTYQFMVSKGGHEQAMVDLENSPNYVTAQRAGLANDPRRGYDEYQSPWMAKTLGKLGISGNRAFDSLKTMRQDMFDSAWNRMSEANRTPDMAKIISEEINASTGASKAFSGRDWPSRFVGKAMFAAPLEASRWEFLVRDNARAIQAFGNWKNASPEARYMAKRVASRNAQLVATYASLLALNQGLLMATKSDDKINFTDPTKADFLAFKIGGRTISPASGMLTAVRFMGTLASQAKNADLKKPSQTVEDMAKTTFKYGRSKLSPLFSTGADVALRSDYSGRPLPFSAQEGTAQRPRYSWLEYILSQQTPIPVGEGVRDVYTTMREQGMTEGQTKSLLKALAESVPVAAIAATGIRVGRSYQPSEAERQRTRKLSFQERFLKGQIGENDLNRAAKNSELSQSDIDSILREKDIQNQYTPFQAALYKAPVLTSNKTSPALDRFERMDQLQRAQVRSIMQDKADAIMDSDALTENQKRTFAERIKKAGLIVRGN